MGGSKKRGHCLVQNVFWLTMGTGEGRKSFDLDKVQRKGRESKIMCPAEVPIGSDQRRIKSIPLRASQKSSGMKKGGEDRAPRLTYLINCQGVEGLDGSPIEHGAGYRKKRSQWEKDC